MTDRRILLVSYHFGRDGPTGGFRWNAAAEHLCSFGWDVDVITAARVGLDTTAKPSGPGSLEILPVEPVRWPFQVKEALLVPGRWVRDLFGVRGASADKSRQTVDPDALFVWRAGYRRSFRERLLHGLDYIERACAELAWSARAVRIARPLLRARSYRAVVVSSPPHLTQTVGERLAREFGVPYVGDYRDPWTLGLGSHLDYLNDLERVVGRRHEVRVLRAAHTVIHNTEAARLAIAAELPIPGEHYAIPNGYDATEEVDAPDAKCFRVVYTGHLYPFMDVRPLFAACSQLRERHHLDAGSMQIEFIGTEETVEGVRLTDLAEAYGLDDVFSRRPRVSQAEVADFQRAASVLVAYDWLFPIAVVSKFYEYARMKGTMLLIGNTEGALADAAAELGLRVLDASDWEGIEAVLEGAFDRWGRGDFDRPLDGAGFFARSSRSQRIREVLGRL